MNPYEVLGVGDNVTEEQLRKIYIDLARKFHPDTARSEEERVEKEKRFKEITYAYGLLKGKLKETMSTKDKGEKKGLDVDLIKKRAQIFIKNGDFNSAIGMLKVLDEDDYDTNMLLGLAFFKKKRHHRAVEYFKKAIELNPWKAYPYVYMGEVYSEIDLKKSAMHYYREALKIDPNNSMALRGIEKLNKSRFSIKSLFKKG